MRLNGEIDLTELKAQWLEALSRAERFIGSQDPTEAGCLYYDQTREQFVAPAPDERGNQATIVPHYGRPGGVLPVIRD